MIEPDNEQTIMRKYLLAELEEPLQEEVDERIVCDKAFAERLGVAQDDLIDDYVFDGLSESEREDFQKNFLLDDERRQKLMIAQAFEVYVAEGKELQPMIGHESWAVADRWRNALGFFQRHKFWVTLAFAAILLFVFFAPQITRLILPKATAPVDEERARIERQLAELNSRPLVTTDQVSMALTLQPTRLREGGELRKVVLNKENKLVKLQLEFSSAVKYAKYRTVVRTVEGRELFTIDNLKSESGVNVVVLRIPSEFLSTGDYQIELYGISEDGVAASVALYDFRIIKSRTT
ncbi:MAG: hypothetical protein QOE96_202 [Blastocatellia bacterium]|jgi:hypothetical protein|nr:hypothetical protein [Blastocatellia bacterium]